MPALKVVTMGNAKDWVERAFPTARGNEKGRLILAYGAGIEQGLGDAEEIVLGVLRQVRELMDPDDAVTRPIAVEWRRAMGRKAVLLALTAQKDPV
jgi:hypothetical protein